jgi:hypothetical protein
MAFPTRRKTAIKCDPGKPHLLLLRLREAQAWKKSWALPWAMHRMT